MRRVSSRALRGLAGLGGHDPLLEDHLGFLGVFLQERPEPLVHGRLDEALDLDVQQLVLRLALEAGLGELDGDDRDEPLAQVVAAGADVLQQADALGVLQHRVRQARLEPGQVRAAVVVVDVVGEREDRLVVAVAVLQRDLDLDVLLGVFLLEADDRRRERLALVEELDVLGEALVVLEHVALPDALVLVDDLDAGVEERQLAEAVHQGFVDELDAAVGLGKEGGVGLEGDLGAGLVALADDLEVRALHAARELHVVDRAVAADLDLEPFADEVDDGRADAVQPAGGLVGGGVVVGELAAGAERGEDDFDGRDAFGRVDADGHAAAVVGDGAGAVGVDLHVDALAVAGEGLVDGVVDDLVDEVVQAARVVAADVHARARADVLDIVEDADLRFVVLCPVDRQGALGGFDRGGRRIRRVRRFRRVLVSHPIAPACSGNTAGALPARRAMSAR